MDKRLLYEVVRTLREIEDDIDFLEGVFKYYNELDIMTLNEIVKSKYLFKRLYDEYRGRIINE